jgi:transposase
LGRVSKYSEEFRRQGAMLVVDGRRPVREIARELDVNHETLRNWVAALRRERATSGGPVGVDERAESSPVCYRRMTRVFDRSARRRRA